MLKFSLCAAVMLATGATAQVTPYKTSNASSVADADKVICKREEQIGSRLASKKVCLTAREWEVRKAEGRDQMEDVQAGARMRDGPDPDNAHALQVGDVPR